MVVTIRIDSKISFDYRELKDKKPKTFRVLKKKFKKKNPTFTTNEKYGYSNHDTDEYLKAIWFMKKGRCYVARGCKIDLLKFFKTHKIKTEIIDKTLHIPQKYPQKMNCEPRDDQPIFIDMVRKHHSGLLLAPTSFGKSLSCLMTAYYLEVPILILVHRQLLQEQWIKEATNPKTFNLPKELIGGCGGKFKKPKVGLVNICLYQSLSKPEMLRMFGNVNAMFVFDEVQYGPIEACLKIINHIPARYKIGVSADHKRKDGKDFVTQWFLGPVLKRFVERDGANKILGSVALIETPYKDADYEWDSDAVAMETRATRDKVRNNIAISRCKRAIDSGRQVLLCTSRKYHACRLAKHFTEKGYRVGLILGTINKKKDIPEYAVPAVTKVMLEHDSKGDYQRVKELAEKKELDIIICTHQKAGTGMSITTLDFLFCMSMITGNKELLNQLLGRVERKYTDSQAKDFGHEKPKPMAEFMWDAHCGKPDKDGRTNKYKHKYVLSDKYKKRFRIVKYKK
jgi:superfamily II DNA or RNA helicase